MLRRKIIRKHIFIRKTALLRLMKLVHFKGDGLK